MNTSEATLFGNYEIMYAPHYAAFRQSPEFYRNHDGVDVVATVTINNKTNEERQFDIVACGEMRYVFPLDNGEVVTRTDDLFDLGIDTDERLDAVVLGFNTLGRDVMINNPWFEIWEYDGEGYEYLEFAGFRIDEAIQEVLEKILPDPKPTQKGLPDNVIPLW